MISLLRRNGDFRALFLAQIVSFCGDWFATVAALLILMASSLGAFRSRDATRLLVAIALWCLVRAAVATTWRDPVVAGPLPMGGVIALVIAAGALAGAIVEGAWLPRRSRATRASAQPAWPDPETRPPF